MIRKDAPLTQGISTSYEGRATYLSEPSLSTGMCEMPRLLEKSDLLEEILAKPFPPATRVLHQCQAKLDKAHPWRPLCTCGRLWEQATYLGSCHSLR